MFPLSHRTSHLSPETITLCERAQMAIPHSSAIHEETALVLEQCRDLREQTCLVRPEWEAVARTYHALTVSR